MQCHHGVLQGVLLWSITGVPLCAAWETDPIHALPADHTALPAPGAISLVPSLLSQMWTSVRTTMAAASRSASMPWAATSVSATVAFSSATTSIPASTAPTVSTARADGARPPPPQIQGPWKLPSPRLDSGGLGIQAGNLGGGLNGCFVLLVWALHRPPPSSRPPPATPGLVVLLVFLCGGEVGPQMGRCDQRSCFPFWAEGRLWPGRVGPHPPWSPFPKVSWRSDQAECQFLGLRTFTGSPASRGSLWSGACCPLDAGWDGRPAGAREWPGAAPGWDRTWPLAEPSR